uniref:C1q domain-containing protein n=1 Tax=Magallana gigas TaxID=29159 RepID=A0A8W8K638_MAGGI
MLVLLLLLTACDGLLLNGDASMKSRDPSVAFFSYLTDNIVNPSAGTRMTFRGVDVNTGSAYDATTGVFTAPVPGVYSFAFTASGCNVQCSSITVVHLNKGDTVWMEIPSATGSNTVAGHGNFDGGDQYHTHFSGFLIHSD